MTMAATEREHFTLAEVPHSSGLECIPHFLLDYNDCTAYMYPPGSITQSQFQVKDSGEGSG